MPDLVCALQVFAGPRDIPKRGDIAGQKKAQAALVAWWKRSEGEKPVVWLLESLAARGYSTADPSDTVKTSQGLVLAIQKGAAAQRYAAERALAYLLPDGDGIPANAVGLLPPASIAQA